MELHRLGRRVEAEALYRQTLGSMLDRARSLIRSGDAAGAMANCDEVIELAPGVVDAWFLRGNALQLLDAHEGAIESYEHALRNAPAFAAALNNKAHSLRMLHRPAEALATLERALLAQPTYGLAFNNRGLALLDLGRASEAVESFDAALAVQPNLAEAVGNRGTALLALKRFPEAAVSFEQLDARAPGFDAVLGNLLFARRHCCDWDDQDALQERIIAAVQRGEVADLPLAFLYSSDVPADQLTCAAGFVRSRYPERSTLGAPAGSPDQPRIRVAYLSGDFGEHAVSHLLAGVLERHDRVRFETVGVGWGRRNDGLVRRRLEAAFERFVDATELSDLQLATLLRELEIDIAIDLMGHTHGQRTGVFALRAAPLQVNYLGFPGTTGAPYMDYVIGDSVVIPAGEEDAYSERIVRLPHCCLPTDDGRPMAAEPPTRAAAGLPPAGFVYCAFNGTAKITRDMFRCWLRLLAHVPGSVLWLRAPGAAARENLQREARALGLDPDRLVFADAVASMASHLARHRLADLFLDTLPYNAHATACDALWAGLPVLTCRGRSFAGRVGTSLLQAVGLGELVAESMQEYEAKALEFAQQPGKLAAIKATLAARRTTHPLFDTDLYTRHLEAAYVSMTLRQRRGLPPAGLSIAALNCPPV
jgi:predicted O-linked N-acetylglucosamine transferase (SPINDLY family)